jgi:hypothetical protein
MQNKTTYKGKTEREIIHAIVSMTERAGSIDLNAIERRVKRAMEEGYCNIVIEDFELPSAEERALDVAAIPEQYSENGITLTKWRSLLDLLEVFVSIND